MKSYLSLILLIMVIVGENCPFEWTEMCISEKPYLSFLISLFQNSFAKLILKRFSSLLSNIFQNTVFIRVSSCPNLLLRNKIYSSITYTDFGPYPENEVCLRYLSSLMWMLLCVSESTFCELSDISESPSIVL